MIDSKGERNMAGSKRTGVPPKEWAKHLRPFGKKLFNSTVRNFWRSEEKKDLLKTGSIYSDKIDDANPAFPKDFFKDSYIKENNSDLNALLAQALDVTKEKPMPHIVAKRIDDGVTLDTIESLGGNRITPETMEERLLNANKLCENGVQPLTDFKSIFPPPFKPFEVTVEERVNWQKNGEYTETLVAVIPQEEKPVPKIVTIEVSGLPNTGKIMIMQLIDEAIRKALGVMVLSAELEDEPNLINLDEIPQFMLDKYSSGEIYIEMKMKEIKPFPTSLTCPCCD